MRITNNMLINNTLSSLSTNLTRTSKYQDQLATGKKISKPSDNPIVASKSLKLRTDVAEIAQYKRNTDDATSWMEITESTIGQLGEVMQRTRELLVQGSNGTNSTSDMQIIASEVEQLKQQAIHLANATYAGRYVFSGYKTDKPLMDENGDFFQSVDMNENVRFEIGIGDNLNINVSGGDLFNLGANAVASAAGTSIGNNVAVVPVTIVAGVNDQLDISIDGNLPVSVTIPSGTYNDPFVFLSAVQSSINAAAPGGTLTATFSSGKLKFTSDLKGAASSVSVDVITSTAATVLGMATVSESNGTDGERGTLIKMFDDILVALSTGGNVTASELLADVDTEMANMLRVRSGVGARMNRLELTANRLDDDNIGFTKLMSQNEDVDMAEAIMNLTNEQNVYQASLSTAAKVIQPSLVDYLN